MCRILHLYFPAGNSLYIAFCQFKFANFLLNFFFFIWKTLNIFFRRRQQLSRALAHLPKAGQDGRRGHLVSRAGGTREAGEAAELALHGWKRYFPGGKEWGSTTSQAGWMDTTRNIRQWGRGDKRAEEWVTGDQRDVEGMRDRIKTSRSKTEIAKLNSDTLQKKYTFSDGQRQQHSYPKQNCNFNTKSDSLKYDSASINRKIP